MQGKLAALWGRFTPAQQKALSVLLAAIIAALVAFEIIPAGEADQPAPPTSSTVTAPTGPTVLTTTPEAAVDASANDHKGAVNQSPEGVSPEALATAEAQREAFAQKDQLPTEIPDAAPQQRGCRTRLVQNKSSRNGVKPRLLVLHYTVSPNRPGFTDVDAITNLFNQRSFAASSTYVVDKDGNCNYIVREAEKPWTQATFNPVSISWEIINTGSEKPLFTAAGFKNFARTVVDAGGRWDIPIRLGAVNTSTCTVTRSGIVDHNMLGACGGGHHDITPFSITEQVQKIKAYQATTSTNTRKNARWCRSLNIIRAQARDGRSTPERRQRARQLKALLERDGYSCPR